MVLLKNERGHQNSLSYFKINMLKNFFYSINSLFIAISAYALIFLAVWNQTKNYSMSMREIWIIGIPFVVILFVSSFFNTVYFFTAKNKSLREKILLGIFLPVDLIGIILTVRLL
jgi:hypothetical protein